MARLFQCLGSKANADVPVVCAPPAMSRVHAPATPTGLPMMYQMPSAYRMSQTARPRAVSGRAAGQGITARRSLAGVSLRMEGEKEKEPDDKAKVIGAAAAAGLLGVELFGEVLPAVVLAAGAAYAATTTGAIGGAAGSVGSFAAKAFDKTVELNEEYEILPKAKNATDTVVKTASNLNENYGITEQLDKKLMLSSKISDVKGKIDDLTSDVSGKVDDLKKSATSPKDA